MTHEAAYPDLAHAIAHAGPDEPTEDADGYVTWDGRGGVDTSQDEPCAGNANVCIAEGCFGRACLLSREDA